MRGVIEATVRPSLAFYNTLGEIDRLADIVTALARLSGLQGR